MPASDEKTPIEVELKLAVAPADLPRLQRRLARLGDGDITPVDSVYYDTADRLLAQRRMALRLRHLGRRWLQTLKSEMDAAALSRRGEWEMAAPRGRLDLARLADTPLAALLREFPRARLRPVFRTRFSRRLWQINDGAIEIALDQGEIVAGARSAPILELELELKAGPDAALYRVALELTGEGQRALALRPAIDSKAVRGYRLAAGELPAPRKANARAVVGTLPSQTSAAVALRLVVERATTLLLVNADAHGTATDIECVHQARVAVRRLRSAVRVLGKAAAWPQALDDDLRWIGGQLGAVRDWDVLQAQTLPALIAALPADAQLQSLFAPLAKQRRRDDRALGQAICSARLARLALRLLQWAHTPPPPAVTLAALGAKRLPRLHEQLVAASVSFATLPAAKQHRVRIRAKRLRYALDVFAGTLPAGPAARYGKQLARLQDQLGALNDGVVAPARLMKLARAAGCDVAPALEWLEMQRQQHALQAEAALAALARMSVPWR